MADNTTTNSSADFQNATKLAKGTLDLSTIRYGYFIGMGIIIMLGFVCNTLSIAVFAKSKVLRQSTTGLYLVSLAVADLLFLVGELLRWLETEDYIPGYNFMSYSNAACQFVYSLRYTAKLTSAWITVVITAQRYFIVAFPLRAGSICTRKQAYIGITSTYLICFLVGCYPVLCVGVGTWRGKALCMLANEELYDILSWIFLRVGSLLLPGAIVLVLTVLICVILARARITRNRHLSENRTNKGKMNKGQSSNGSVDRQLTLMLLAVAIAFVLLRLPYTILYYLNTYQKSIWNPDDYSTRYTVYALYKVSDLFASLNYALNFFLYCLSGTAFRMQCVSLLTCSCDEAIKRKSTSYGPTSSTPNGHSSLQKTAYTRQSVVCASDGNGKGEDTIHMDGYGDLHNTTLETMD